MLYIKPYYLLPFLLLFARIAPVSAQISDLNLTALNSDNGLSQHTIQCIFKDKYGFMWFGTQDGLNKYDGYKFTIYKHQYNNAHTLPANNITAICADASGNMWVGTRTGGLSRYNYDLDRFDNFKHNPYNLSSISNNSISNIYLDKDQKLWIGTANGLNMLNGKWDSFKRYTHTSNNAESLSDAKVLSIFEDSGKNFWIGTANGLNLLNRATGKSIRYSENNITNKNTDNTINTINTITEDDTHQLWMGTNKGLKLLNRGNGTFTYFAIQPDKNSPKGINPIAAVTKTEGNKIWIATYSTLLLFDANSKKLIPISGKGDGDTQIPNDGIYALLEDRDGILWIGTSSQGILMYDRNLSTFPIHKASLNNRPSAKNIVRALDEDKQGNLYLATDEGLDYFNRITHAYNSYYHQPNNIYSLASNYTTLVVSSKKDGRVWVGTDNSGLDCLDPQTGIFTHYVKGNGPKNISDNSIYGLLEDRQGNIWIGTYQGGLNVFNIKTKTFARYLHNPKDLNSLGDNSIQALFEDKAGNIWIGGYSNGISIYNPATKKFTQLNNHNSNLKCDIISVFYEDKQGNMWIGTMEGGLNFYNKTTKQFTAYTEQNGLINNTINYITEDINSNLWLTTNRGITRFDPVKKTFKSFDNYNGLKSLEYNIGAGLKLSDGQFAFGSINGFSFIDPQNLGYNKNTPQVVITGFELFNKPVQIGAKGSPLKQTILTTKELTLNHTQSVFSIDYAALNFTTPQHNTYAYLLEGFDYDWRYVGTQRKATYTNLDAGTYTFRIKAANNDGVWSNKETTIFITIKPPYWKTWWFRLIIALAILGLTYEFTLYRAKQRAKLRKLEENKFKDMVDAVINAQEEERRRIAEALHNEFGQLLFAAKMGIPAEQLATASILNEAITKVRNISYELMPPILEDYGLEYALEDMIAKKLTAEHIKYTCTIKGLKERISPVLEIATYRITQELLNNVVKHANATFVDMSVIKNLNTLSIHLTDNGVGFNQSDEHPIKKKNEFGLNYITGRVHLLKGTVKISPAQPKGTEIAIQFPLAEIY
jgi:ligand-binding sensor domain-containing protein/signal transduction histidine kinase